MEKSVNKLINLRYSVNDLKFDAAVDCDGLFGITDSNSIIVELFCLDRPEWDVFRYKQHKNDILISSGIDGDINTPSSVFIDLEVLMNKTKEWIEDSSK